MVAGWDVAVNDNAVIVTESPHSSGLSQPEIPLVLSYNHHSEWHKIKTNLELFLIEACR
jgi:hypothetical protein